MDTTEGTPTRPSTFFRLDPARTCSLVFVALSSISLFSSCGRSDTTSASRDAETEGAPAENAADPRWIYRQTPPSKVAVVFVHGIFGHTVDTWKHASGKSFFGFLHEAPEIGAKVDVFAFGFTSNMLKAGSLDIVEAGNVMHQQLMFHGVLDYPTIVFVTHSMGGLVVMRHLLSSRKLLEKVPLVVEYATPQEGSQITTIATKIARNPALEQMFPADKNSFLYGLDTDWKNLDSSVRPKVICGYEKLKTGPIMVVSWESATRFCDGASPPMSNTDHLSIVKPDRATHDSVVLLINALRQHVLSEAKLDLPDFTLEGDQYALLLPAQGWISARLVNAAQTRVRYTIAHVDPLLVVLPDDTPKYIGGTATEKLEIALLRGATAGEYRFEILAGDLPPIKIKARAPDLVAIRSEQDRLKASVFRELNRTLADPASRWQSSKPAEGPTSEELVGLTFDSMRKVQPQLAPNAAWILSADLLNDSNWPQLAALALREAEKRSPSLAAMESTQLLAGKVAANAGIEHVFATVKTPKTDQVTVNFLPGTTRLDVIEAGAELSKQLQTFPSAKSYGLSLEGDVLQFKGQSAAARVAFDKAAAIQTTPSVKARASWVGGGASSIDLPNQMSAKEVLKADKRTFQEKELSTVKRPGTDRRSMPDAVRER